MPGTTGVDVITTEHPTPVAADRVQHGDASPAATRAAALCALPVTPRSVPAVRRFVRGAVRSWAVPADTEDTLLLVVSELVTNVVLHSTSAEVTVLVSFDGVVLTAEVKDQGRWLTRRTPRRVAEDDDAAFGRGLALVTACTSWWATDVTADGTRVVAHCPVAGAAPENPTPEVFARARAFVDARASTSLRAPSTRRDE
ncbi:ATP-binding protein [Streptomyces sp. NPDC014776]|uniref:ATP-binding protein n=1 Tax=unclassified Streptomyces TaxID=2593676 RepID=UPI0036FB6988